MEDLIKIIRQNYEVITMSFIICGLMIKIIMN